MRRHVVGGLVAVALTGALLVAVYQAYARYEANDGRYPVQGIDVSGDQGDIDWTALAGGNRPAFVYMRATDAGGQADAQFAANWSGAAQVGIDRGAYHAFSLCRSGTEQARDFMATVPVDPEALPPAVTLGLAGDCPDVPPRDAIVAELTAFLGAIDRQYGKQTLVFTTADAYRSYLDGALDDRAFWLRSLIARPRFGPEAWFVWQYNDRGWRDGIGRPVNLDAFYGNAAEYDAFHATGGDLP